MTIYSAMRRALTCGLVAFATGAFGQGWPTKPVRWILPSAAGSAPDVVARLLGDRLSTVWGQQVLIDNRPGAAGNIAAVATKNATPDGYTYFFAQASTMAVNPFTFKSFPFDPDKDFAGAPIYSGAHDATVKMVESGKVQAGALNRLGGTITEIGYLGGSTNYKVRLDDGATLIAALWIGQVPSLWLLPAVVLMVGGLVLVIWSSDGRNVTESSPV